MNTNSLQEIQLRYPNLYKHNVSFECYNGWYDIIDDLSCQLERLIGDDEHCYVVQVKEKFGTLRFYLSCETDEMSRLIERAEGRSAQTCEICGEPGVLQSKFRWLFTRCETHKNV